MNPEDTKAFEIKYEIVPYTRGTVLELGPGPWKTYPHFIGVDLLGHVPIDARNLSIFASQAVDAVFSSYLLNEFEVKDHIPALKEWWRVIKRGGHLVLYLPINRFSYKLGQIIEFMKQVGYWDMVENSVRQESIFLVFKKISSGHHFTCNDTKPLKSCAVVRYGGAGDMIQTASVIHELKAAGYHITLYTSEDGYKISKSDPNVDEFVVQSKDQVPNNELSAFWAVLKPKYEKFVQLSESVEGTFLALPGRTIHTWPKTARHMVADHNYLFIMHLIAEIPYTPRPRFYPTPEEAKWAKKLRKKIHGRVILWCLSGSSAHKTWPWMDQIIARLMLEYKDVNVVLTGDPLSEMLESGWENEKRVIRTCGKWSMRQSLTFAEHSDLVIGPETGVLNAVSMLNIPKICYLSHSSVTNLTRDWKNTVSLTPEDCACYPCHILHHGFAHCSRDEATGTAECQAKISPERMWEAVKNFLEK